MFLWVYKKSNFRWKEEVEIKVFLFISTEREREKENKIMLSKRETYIIFSPLHSIFILCPTPSSWHLFHTQFHLSAKSKIFIKQPFTTVQFNRVLNYPSNSHLYSKNPIIHWQRMRNSEWNGILYISTTFPFPISSGKLV